MILVRLAMNRIGTMSSSRMWLDHVHGEGLLAEAVDRETSAQRA